MIVSQNRRKRPIAVLARKVIESGICLTYVIPRTRAMPIYMFKGCAYFFSKSRICSFAPPFIMGIGTGLFILLIVGLILWHLAVKKISLIQNRVEVYGPLYIRRCISKYRKRSEME